jgi:hypothetical protein
MRLDKHLPSSISEPIDQLVTPFHEIFAARRRCVNFSFWMDLLVSRPGLEPGTL